MRMIYADYFSLGLFRPRIVEAEKISKMWKIISSEDGQYTPSRVSSDKLIPYSDEVWEEVQSIKRTESYLWARKLKLRELTVQENK